MAFIKDAVSSLLGGGNDTSWQWAEHLHPASFRGVPFAVVSGESVFGRRQAVHEYPYRDTAWLEDLGRATRRITLRGFIIQNSAVYHAPDVITQRKNLVAACETGSTGTLVHPTLGELTVSVTESGLRMNESKEFGRVFEFTLTVIESGLKVFAISEYIGLSMNVSGLSELSSGQGYQAVEIASAQDPEAEKMRYRNYVTIIESTLYSHQRQQEAIDWEMNRRYGRSKVLKVLVDSWRDVSGTLWTPNTLIPIHLPVFGLESEQWLLSEVSYVRNKDDGTRAELTLMPPAAFTVQPYEFYSTLMELRNGGY
ncbi:tail protein [Xenorhabdus stockiae]|uniref:Tail protein n=1 Tax=Xenorhabdus stockiae TaxID=351614 RepID=A0A2D0KLB9_9GAMM|nr:DNA circularization N-terminal domain-containing protein [Xenorhabdus stockiae]PHM64230.1 tail protein [Xenorhabdus stockiae]